MNNVVTLKSVINFFRSPLPTILLLFIILVFTLIMFFLHRKNNKWLIWSSIPSFITSAIFFIIFLAGQSLMVLLFSESPKEVASIINPFIDMVMNNILLYSIILFVIGLVMIIIYIILNKKKNNNVEFNNQIDNNISNEGFEREISNKTEESNDIKEDNNEKNDNDLEITNTSESEPELTTEDTSNTE